MYSSISIILITRSKFFEIFYYLTQTNIRSMNSYLFCPGQTLQSPGQFYGNKNICRCARNSS